MLWKSDCDPTQHLCLNIYSRLNSPIQVWSATVVQLLNSAIYHPALNKVLSRQSQWSPTLLSRGNWHPIRKYSKRHWSDIQPTINADRVLTKILSRMRTGWHWRESADRSIPYTIRPLHKHCWFLTTLWGLLSDIGVCRKWNGYNPTQLILARPKVCLYHRLISFDVKGKLDMMYRLGRHCSVDGSAILVR